MATTRKIFIVKSEMRKKCKHNTKGSPQTTKEERKRRRKEQRGTRKSGKKY